MITIFSATLNEDWQQIINLIYETDPYIYSAMCDNDYTYFEQVMKDCLFQNSIFSYKNIHLAKENDKIVGLLLSFTKNNQLPCQNNIIFRQCFTDTLLNYFSGLVNKLKPDVLYINNLCVDKSYRNKGIGSMLLKYLKDSQLESSLLLDCLVDNKDAIRLYEKCGFIKGQEFEGFAGNSSDTVRCVEFVLEGGKNKWTK